MSYKKRKKDSDDIREILFPKYSNKELDEFEVYLDTFRRDVEVNVPQKEIIHPIDIHKALVDFGAESVKVTNGVSEYSIVLEDVVMNTYGSVESYKRPTKQELFFDKWEQLKKLRGRQDYFDAKKTEAYTKMAEEMTVDPIPDTF